MEVSDERSTVDDLWAELVTTSLLGTDRRDPPEIDGIVGEFVAETVRADPSARMLAAVAACTAVRRAGIRPAEPVDPIIAPGDDRRPECPPAATRRWHHITTSWPVLEDEWTVVLIDRGWRSAPELIPAMLRRHRRDPVRRRRVLVAAGPLAGWLIDHVPELAAPIDDGLDSVDADQLLELPALPIPQELADLVERPGHEVGGVIGVGLEDGTLGAAHRAVLINVIARCDPGGLADLADVLDAVDTRSPGHGLASLLSDLAMTRRRMLDELSRPGDSVH